MDIHEFINKKLEHRRNNNSFRELKTSSNIDFVSNDYLGLARSEDLFNLIQQRITTNQPHRNGAGGSRLLAGNTEYTETVENKLATIFKSESTLLFNSGYTANMGVLSSLPGKDDTILYDELSHACIKDGARLSLATRHSFRHNNVADLEKKIKQSKGIIYIVVESIYSMDGDTAPLEELVQLKKKYNAFIIVDEAHSTGVVGENGSGLCINRSLDNDIDVRIYTFGKAMGAHGACVACSNEMRHYFINFSRPFIYTTALPMHSIIAIDCAFEYLGIQKHLQEQLNSKIKLFKSLFQSETYSTSAIQPIIIAGNSGVREAAFQLQQEGFDIRPVLAPTVKEGSERLRVCLHTFNSDEEIASLTQKLNDLVNK